MKVNCNECEYWVFTRECRQGEGECRKESPKSNANGFGFWPITKEVNGFCFSGKRKESDLLTEGESILLEHPPQ